MTDEATELTPAKASTEDGSSPGEPLIKRRRVKRRRSATRSRHVQSRLPFTTLRFSRPRLPTLTQSVMLAFALGSLGLSAWAIRTANVASATLNETRAQLAMNMRGAAAGRLAADQLAAQAQADASQMMAAQDMARRQTARDQSGAGHGFAPHDGYPRGSQDDQQGAAAPAPYGAMPYGSPSYAGSAPYGTPPPSLATPASQNVMGYTLPQTPRPQ